jgi:hypothetical protein
MNSEYTICLPPATSMYRVPRYARTFPLCLSGTQIDTPPDFRGGETVLYLLVLGPVTVTGSRLLNNRG